MPNNKTQIVNKTLLLKLFLVVGIAYLFPACSSQDNTETTTANEQKIINNLEKINRILLDVEKQEIIDFIHRYGWKMKETGSGLYYHIYSSGQGVPAELGKTAIIDYTIYLLNGDLVYSSEQEGSKQFTIGRGGVESGLEEAILLLRVGDKARFIMPAHMAHGVPGDGMKIPGQATIVYELTVTEIQS